MKKIIIILLFSLLAIGCDESFNPKADFKEIYVVSSVVQYDIKKFPTNVSVYLTKLYDAENTNPYENKTDPSVSGAQITYSHEQELYPLEERRVPHYNPERYGDSMTVYRSVVPGPDPSDDLRIDITTPDGIELSSKITLPRKLYFKLNSDYPRGFTSNIPDGNSFGIYWDDEAELIYFPKLTASYRFLDGSGSPGVLVLPTEYVDGKPYAPEYIFNSEMNYQFSAIEKTLKSIIEENPESKIQLTGINFSLKVFEKNLAKYYSSTNGYLDAMSIRLDEIVYSNINGGIGIFGAAHSTEYEMLIERGWANSLGFSN